MDRRFATFIALSALVLLVNIWLMRMFEPPPGQKPAGQEQAAAEGEKDKPKPAKKKKAAKAEEGKD